jgi:ribonuclease III family protein
MKKTEQQAGNALTELNEISIRAYAHLGDAVYEVFVREKTIHLTSNAQKLHKLTVSFVNAEFQTEILAEIEKAEGLLNEDETDIIRRARNLTVTTARRTNQKIHRQSTAFEALIGYLYLNDKQMLDDLFKVVDKFIEEKLGVLILT